MMANDQISGRTPALRRNARLRLIGSIVLALGISGAGVVYWLGTRSPDLSDDLSMLGYNKAERREMGRLYGQMGTLVEDWSEDLKRPGTQAVLILSCSALVAGGCFYFSRLIETDDKAD
jgi:hypothetical protein